MWIRLCIVIFGIQFQAIDIAAYDDGDEEEEKFRAAIKEDRSEPGQRPDPLQQMKMMIPMMMMMTRCCSGSSHGIQRRGHLLADRSYKIVMS